MNTTQTPSLQPLYKFYVGKGNNHPLVQNLFKQRWWFVQVDKIELANVSWTQLKDNEILKGFKSNLQLN